MKLSRHGELQSARRRGYLRALDDAYPHVEQSTLALQRILREITDPVLFRGHIVAYAKHRLATDIRRTLERRHVLKAESAMDRLYGLLLACRACPKQQLDTLDNQQLLRARQKIIDTASPS